MKPNERPSTIDGILKKLAEHPRLQVLLTLLGCCCLLFAFIKLPSSSLKGSHQSWEPILAYGAGHHLLWGKDIVFTYGPLSFLSLDYYWGYLFWPILAWAFGFALIAMTGLRPFLHRLVLPNRALVYVALPLLTVPACMDLGFDPIYFFAITFLGIACLPDENPGGVFLACVGAVFSVLVLSKFTFALYCVFTIVVMVVASICRRKTKNALALVTSFAVVFISACWFQGQNLQSIVKHFTLSFQMASGYSSAMNLMPEKLELILATSILISISVLVGILWHLSRGGPRPIGRILLLLAGLFLAWKEGFVRPDQHVIVFFVYSFLVTVLLPAFLSIPKALVQNATPNGGNLLELPFLPRPFHLLSVLTLLLALTPFGFHQKSFVKEIETGAYGKVSDTASALFTTRSYKSKLESLVEELQRYAELPEIRAAVGQAPVAALGLHQDLAILNKLNYKPHPVIQSYAAYTPGLQELNKQFFQSSAAPEFVLGRSVTIDSRFPTVDDGSVLLELLSSYSPILQENGLVLWKRKTEAIHYAFKDQSKTTQSFEQWIPVLKDATWLSLETKRTRLGSLQSFLFNSRSLYLEAKLEDGRILTFRLPPGNAQSGFILNPLINSESDLVGIALQKPECNKISAVRLSCPQRNFFSTEVVVNQQTIAGIPGFEAKPLPLNTSNVSLSSASKN
jgi:hypothetical protein